MSRTIALGTYRLDGPDTLAIANTRWDHTATDLLIVQPHHRDDRDLLMVGVSTNDNGADLADGILIGLNRDEALQLRDAIDEWLPGGPT